MTRYPVYLEIDSDGRCLAHVLELPGCIVRAPSRDEALAWMPDAIRDHHAWLHHHGEAAPLADAAIEVEVAAESTGFGPFERGSRAALFPPDREPVTAEEMEVMFCLLAYSRADLLSLIAALSWSGNPTPDHSASAACCATWATPRSGMSRDWCPPRRCPQSGKTTKNCTCASS
jgi:predicted RNase H-like HicB family nuclease